MCARNQAQADKHQGLFRQDAFRGREDNTQELSHDHDTVLGECVVSGIRHLVFDKKKNTPWVERNRAKQRNLLIWENGHRAFLLFEIETDPMWADEHKKKFGPGGSSSMDEGCEEVLQEDGLGNRMASAEISKPTV